jgi:hypothetical protein
LIDPQLLGLVSAATALVASVLGPLTTLYIGRLQIRASVLSANRQKWIDTFRETMATFCAQAAIVVQLRDKIVSDGKVHLSTEPEILRRSEALVQTIARIRLLVDPLDVQQGRMLTLMQEHLEAMMAAPADAELGRQFEAMSAQIVELSLAVLRKEWERVKRMD